MKKSFGFFIFIFVIIFIVVISSFSNIISFVTDYKWFGELGYTKTFLTKLVTQFKIGVPAFIVLFILIMIYIFSIKKAYYKKANIIPNKDGEKRLNLILRLASALVAFFIASTFASNLWFTVLKFTNSTNFNLSDPLFNKDLSFYIFKLPLLREIMSLILFLAFIMVVVTIIFYVAMLTIRRPNIDSDINYDELADRGNLTKLLNKKIFDTALIQLGVIGVVIFIAIGINYFLKTYDLLYSTRGVAYGASYTDVHVTLWVYRSMAIVSIISAIGVLIGAVKKRLKVALAGPALLIAISIIGGIGGGLVQRFVVEPDEISKEQQYLESNIEYTQKAYKLDKVTEKEFPVDQDLTKTDIQQNDETVDNIRINDYRPINQVYNQLQGIRLYYKFNDIDIDRYTIDGEYTQVFLSARELDSNKLPTKTWINEHLKYTHGYGFALSPVNSVTGDGQPELLVKNIPPSTTTDLNITRPEIYFGEMNNDYVVLNTDEKEFDYPQGSDNKETIYEGTAGIELSGLNRLLFTIRQGSLKMLLSGNINSDSKIVIYRNINQRVRKIAPFITYDKDPYLVVNQDDGKMYWIIDVYTMSNKYPYSQPFGETDINYIRNSVKVVIDAYNGDTKYYVFDDTDPVVKTYQKIFPDLFLDKDKMPQGIKEHTRYPQLLFDIQSEIYKVYHVDNTMVFYNSEDIWDIAQEKYMEGVQNIESNYVMFKLPDEDKAEFLLTIPYTPATKPNMTSLFVARNDGENYGKLFLYKFPKGRTIDGPMMIESRIDQNSNISPQLTLWSQKGSDVLRGNLMVVPIENSLLYVEPIYLQADNENSLPEMKRVIVAFKNKVVMEKSLDEALSKIFGDVDEDRREDIDVDEDYDIEAGMEELINQANELFNKAKQSSQSGEWDKYGEYIDRLENILNRLNSSTSVEEQVEEQYE